MRAVSQLLTLALAAGVLAGCGQAPASAPATRAATTAEARVSPAARDKICQMLISEYKAIEWYQNADRKKVVLEAIAATGSDLAVDLLIAEYQSIEWYQNKERKMLFLEMLQKLATPPVESKTEGVVDKVKRLKHRLPSLSALKRLLPALEKDYDDAPTEAKKVLDGLIARIHIIAPGTSR